MYVRDCVRDNGEAADGMVCVGEQCASALGQWDGGHWRAAPSPARGSEAIPMHPPATRATFRAHAGAEHGAAARARATTAQAPPGRNGKRPHPQGHARPPLRCRVLQRRSYRPARRALARPAWTDGWGRRRGRALLRRRDGHARARRPPAEPGMSPRLDQSISSLRAAGMCKLQSACSTSPVFTGVPLL